MIDAIFRRMATDKSIFLVTADMGINLLERFAQAYPDRYVNVGIAEQNLISFCAGLANGGYRPIAYAFSIFASIRCLEQIRDDVALHKHPVIIFGTTAGYDHSSFGPTHQTVDDWGMLRTIPNIEIHCPSSLTYAEHLIEDLLDRPVPAYLRVPKDNLVNPPSKDPVVHLPGAQKRTLMISYGGPSQAILGAQKQDPRLGALVFNRLRPVDDEAVAKVLAEYERLVVVEDHFPETGLYSTICQVLACNGLARKIESRAPRNYVIESAATAEFFWKKFRGNPEALVADLAAT
jgi:transketolase